MKGGASFLELWEELPQEGSLLLIRWVARTIRAVLGLQFLSTTAADVLADADDGLEVA